MKRSDIMSKSIYHKVKILYILKFLMDESDAEHPLSTKDIIDKLSAVEIPAERKQNFEGVLYARRAPEKVPVTLKLIPYNAFANRGSSDMCVWLWAKE
jgi:DUF1680 family protein